ncbi:uncharacterized protein LOC119554596 [Drosophila subpulchrella]|uniref:uncharacterized protein LOC119554596 n=1 Tax=Drosophila subpulchrella TaxID=1486046 RepID=UPI0018A128E3|nr:uncharacterized protein LOC119554596 [Drosophila subpulchrella]XP_037721520.1 uncharacterized protein LOC119554596 [Drosophila subpulchrella]
MGSSSGSVQHLVMLGIILLATNPFGVQAKTLSIHKLEKLVQEEDYLHSRLRIAEFQENVLKVSWDLNLRRKLDNDWMVEFKVSRSEDGDGGYERIMLFEVHLCDFMKTYYKDFFYQRIKEYSNAPRPSTCPLPKEHYRLEDYPLDVRVLKKLMTPGHYRIKYKLKNDESVILSYMAEVEVD